ncbi:MAG: hypothetical protein Q7R52_02365 [archaeon]|nr:hypothetical protein [archaeon]
MLSPIETMALIFVVVLAAKLLIMAVNPKLWDNITNAFYLKPWFTTTILIIYALGALWYLLQELTIIQIFAVMLFTLVLTSMTLGAYVKEIFPVGAKIVKDKKKLFRLWIPMLIWIALSIWVIRAIFF